MYSTAKLNQKTTTEKMDRNSAISLLRPAHESTFKHYGYLNPYFTIKFAWKPEGRDYKVIRFFPSELKRNDDIFIELTDGNNIPLSEDHKLYKLPYNPHYKEEYEEHYSTPNDSSTLGYFVPVSELVEIVKPIMTKDFLLPEKRVEKDLEDCHHTELTARDWACIHLKTPQSNKNWLNELIKNIK